MKELLRLSKPHIKLRIYLILIFILGLLPAIKVFADAPSTVAVQSEASNSSTEIVAKAFELIPEQDLDILMKGTRKEMVIYMQNDSIYKARNIYTGLSWIEELKPDYMRVHLTDVSSIQIKVLPDAKSSSPLIMTIYTITADSDTSDSTIKFYSLTNGGDSDASLAALPLNKYFRLPESKYFYNIKKGSKDSSGNPLNLKDILEEMPFHTVAYTITPEGNELTGRLTISNYLTVEARKRLEPYLRPELRWKWDGKAFRMVTP